MPASPDRWTLPAPGRWERVAIVFTLALVTALYAAPFVTTGLRLGSSGLVPLLDADTYLYTVIARQSVGAGDLIENPWYGTRIPVASVTYLRFGSGIALYGLLEHAIGTELAMAVWTAACALFIAIAAYALCRHVLRLSVPGALAAVLFITLVNLRHGGFDYSVLLEGEAEQAPPFGLPFKRPFFPQLGVIVALGYLATLPRALVSGSPSSYAFLAVLQFAGVLTFPYVTLLCAIATAITGAAIWARPGFRVFPFLLFGAACAILDVGHFLLGPAVAGLGTPWESIIQWDSTWLSLQWGMKWLLIITLLAAVVVRATPLEARVPLLAFAIAIPVTAWTDAISVALQVGHHTLYFSGLATALLMVMLAKEVAQRMPMRHWRHAAIAVGLTCVSWGALTVAATDLFWKPVNDGNRILAERLKELNLGPGDMVIEPVQGVISGRPPRHWEASFVPLVSAARTLLTPASRFLLAPRDVTMHLDRQAVYMHLTGHSEASVRALLRPIEHPNREQFFLAGYGREFPLLGGHRAAVLTAIENEMSPRMALLDGTPDASLAGDGAIVVVDNAENPVFSAERLDRLFRLGAPERLGPWTLRIGRRR